MSKAAPTPAAATKAAEPSTPKKIPPQDATRETLESIAFAFVLALLFRTFIAEAFVIPTGSMAPTLFGRNKDVVCEECHYPYQVGASEEVNEDGYLLSRVRESICPNCRHKNNIFDLPVFKGDRILVNKFPYQISNPERWDVIVFRYPEDPQKNYIKRLVGLPGETIRISRGDVYARPEGQSEFAILRKENPYKQKVLQQLVYDDRYPPVDLLSKGWPERWSSVVHDDAAGSVDGWSRSDQGWKHDPKDRTFTAESSSDPQWIRYQHRVPKLHDWSSSPDGNDQSTNSSPELITDFCGYNAVSSHSDDRYWVGDLTLNCTVEIASVDSSQGGSAELWLELVEGVRRYRCRIDLSSGKATLLRNDDLSSDAQSPSIEMASADTPVRGPGKYTLALANVDDRLCLWVNSNWLNSGLIPFGKGAEYSAPANRGSQVADLCPAGIAVKGAKARVSELVLQRDIYYRADGRFHSRQIDEVTGMFSIRDRLSQPVEYGDLYAEKSNEATFEPLSSDEFFVMGDNSPRSLDSRLWDNGLNRRNAHAVPRQALLGKAFFIYWPHGVPFLNNGKGYKLMNHSREFADSSVENYPEYTFPFYPQWWRWKRIR